MGGGKSHGLIGLWHMASHSAAFAATDIGIAAFADARARLGGVDPDFTGVHVVALCADRMTPFAPDTRGQLDGPAVTLWERFLWRLLGQDYQRWEARKSSWDKQAIAEALRAVGRPILILVDEIMDYVRQLDDAAYADRRNVELAFLKALFDAVSDVPHVALVVVMISTEADRAAYGPLAQAFREELQDNVVRNGTTLSVTEPADFSQIIRRRLFIEPASAAVARATAAAYLNMPAGWQQVVARVPGNDQVTFEEEVGRSYPFHPLLLRMVEREWAAMTGFQRVRSTISLFAQTAYIWAERAATGGWVPTLIGPGDLPLERTEVREALISSGVIANERDQTSYRQVIATDIVGDGGVGGTAASLDQKPGNTWSGCNPRAAQRMATALLLWSLAPRPLGRWGATEQEVKAASFVPDAAYTFGDADTVWNELRDTETGMGALEPLAGGRYRLTTRRTLTMLYKAQRAAVPDTERDRQIRQVAEQVLTRHVRPFARARFVRDEPDHEGRARPAAELLGTLDEEDTTRLVALDAARWTLLNGSDDDTRQAIAMALGVGSRALVVSNASSLVIVAANMARRQQARQKAADLVAWTQVRNLVADDDRLMAEAQDKLTQAKEALDREVRRAYQHYAYLVRDEEGQLEVRYGRFDSDSVSALVGADVWAGLVAAGRAAPVSGLSTDAMLVALAGELPRSLAEVTRLFWTDAQKMLLASDNVLRQALFDALARGRLELIDAAGVLQDVPSGPEDLPLRSSLQRLRWSTADQRAGAHSPGDSAYEAGKEAGGDHAHVDEPGSGPSYDPDAVSGTGTSGEAVTNGSAAGARAELFLRTAADVTDIDLRAAMQGLPRRMANNTDDGYVEAVELTVRLIGSKEQVAEIQALAGQLPGSQIRLDDLPD